MAEEVGSHVKGLQVGKGAARFSLLQECGRDGYRSTLCMDALECILVHLRGQVWLLRICQGFFRPHRGRVWLY
jgi:hypothetical protein